MMLKLMCAVALCGSVHRIDVACISCCCDRVISFSKQVYHSGEADNGQIICNDNALLDVRNAHDVGPEAQDNEQIIYNNNTLSDVRNEYDVVPGAQNNEHIIYDDNALLDVGNEYDVVSGAQNDENLNFAKVLNIEEETQYAYMLQINEMMDEVNGRCTYATDEEIQKLINDDKECFLCWCKFTNDDRSLRLVKIAGCGHLFHALCFCQFYLKEEYVWCPICRNGKRHDDNNVFDYDY